VRDQPSSPFEHCNLCPTRPDLLAAQQPDRGLGFADEPWWSPLAHPAPHSWTTGEPLRLIEQGLPEPALEPKAVCCYGVLRTDARAILWRFVNGRPASHVSTAFLAWVCARLARARQRVPVLIWDNASWPMSRGVRTWIRRHYQRGKRDGGVRLLPCRLPIKSP
jgi:hypothetical protein